MLPPFVIPYLVGTATAPLFKMIVKPLVHGTIKTSVGVALQVKNQVEKLAAEAAEDLRDLAAEMKPGAAVTVPPKKTVLPKKP